MKTGRVELTQFCVSAVQVKSLNVIFLSPAEFGGVASRFN